MDMDGNAKRQYVSNVFRKLGKRWYVNPIQVEIGEIQYVKMRIVTGASRMILRRYYVWVGLMRMGQSLVCFV